MKFCFTMIPAVKIQAIKEVRAVTGLGLKEAKDAVEAGVIEIEPHLGPDLAKALRPYVTGITYSSPVTLDAARARLAAVADRVAGRILSRLADAMERVEARIWKEETP